MPDHHKLFSDKSEIYRDSRPRYPTKLYDVLAELCPNRERVWDAACGNGQAAIDLARHFAEVKATDISKEQIGNAIVYPSVEYSVQPSEVTNFADNTFDMVCVAQALHWFDYNRFWPEVKRVLKPNGIFAAWGYSWFRIEDTIDSTIDREFLAVLQPYWADKNRLLWNHYVDIPFPFERLEMPDIEMAMHWNIDELFAYLHSWSATRRCIDALGDSFFLDAYSKLAEVWGDKKRKRRVVMDFCVIAGRSRV